ncbi:hypothetical protein [Oribacterium sp. WCC10]|nr:hypothetical protein [Oribacterium sp. WCC10]
MDAIAGITIEKAGELVLDYAIKKISEYKEKKIGKNYSLIQMSFY